ncbi:MAG: SDR family NAD(P)-dependent oxidoreductase [Gammaproteobacteria bacterium]|nr:SDR family NAD(P)-dependent oxidoreductase [Gammaproteobacteria bacterium]
MATQTALIIGAGNGLSASLARLFAGEGMQVALAARNPDKLSALCAQTKATAYPCDVADAAQVNALFQAMDQQLGHLDIVVFNPSQRVRGPVAEINPDEVKQALLVSCFGGFLVAQAAAQRMLKRGSGSILLTGATAGVKGFANSASFAMGKFGLRGLAQSMARELSPQGIHVAHFVVDGSIRKSGDDPGDDDRLDPDAIARSYLEVHRQHRSAWSWELELRPWIERF